MTRRFTQFMHVILRPAAVALLWALSANGANAEQDTIRVGMPNFPAGGGVPLTGYALPSILTYGAIFDGMTYLDNDGAFRPALATAWSRVDDLTWRFSLREGVFFSNGESFDANTVEFFVSLLKRPESQAYPVQRELAVIESVRVIDPLTVEIITTAPAPLLPQILAAMRFVAPKYWDTIGADVFTTAPIGTGPYQVSSWTSNQVVLESAVGSWRTPVTPRIELLRIPEATSRLNAMLAEDIDIALGLSPEHVEALSAVDASVQGRRLGNIVVWTFITEHDSPLQDPRVRRAANMAIDRETLIEAFLNGDTRAANQAAIPEAFGYNPDIPPIPFDPEGARALLREAGYGDGFDMTVELVLGGLSNDTAIYQQIASYLSDVGIQATLKTITLAQLVSGIGNGHWSGESFNLDFSMFPALDSMSPQRIHSCLRRIPWFCDDAAMPLIESALVEADLSRREHLTQEVQAYVAAEFPALILFEGVAFDGVSGQVEGYRADFGWIPFHELKKP